MPVATRNLGERWPQAALPAWQPLPAPLPADEELWMQSEDVAPAWAVSAFAGVVLASLGMLALLA